MILKNISLTYPDADCIFFMIVIKVKRIQMYAIDYCEVRHLKFKCFNRGIQGLNTQFVTGILKTSLRLWLSSGSLCSYTVYNHQSKLCEYVSTCFRECLTYQQSHVKLGILQLLDPASYCILLFSYTYPFSVANDYKSNCSAFYLLLLFKQSFYSIVDSLHLEDATPTNRIFCE